MLVRIMSAFIQIFELIYDLFGIYKYCEEKEVCYHNEHRKTPLSITVIRRYWMIMKFLW
jgi:hypothetical protein